MHIDGEIEIEPVCVKSYGKYRNVNRPRLRASVRALDVKYLDVIVPCRR